MTASNVEPLRKSRPCPECGRASTRESYPFCSERCKQADLGSWASEKYRVPVKGLETEDEIDLPLHAEDYFLGEEGDE